MHEYIECILNEFKRGRKSTKSDSPLQQSLVQNDYGINIENADKSNNTENVLHTNGSELHHAVNNTIIANKDQMKEHKIIDETNTDDKEESQHSSITYTSNDNFATQHLSLNINLSDEENNNSQTNDDSNENDQQIDGQFPFQTERHQSQLTVLVNTVMMDNNENNIESAISSALLKYRNEPESIIPHLS